MRNNNQFFLSLRSKFFLRKKCFLKQGIEIIKDNRLIIRCLFHAFESIDETSRSLKVCLNLLRIDHLYSRLFAEIKYRVTFFLNI